MFRPHLVFGLQLFVFLIMCGAAKSTTSKRLQKCLGYSIQAYGQALPNCENLPGNSGVIAVQEFPYIAILGYQKNQYESIGWLCHGTLVSSRYILTTGHCLRYSRLTKARLGAGTSTVYSGESNLSDYDIEEIIEHPLYRPSRYYNDVGLVKLSRKVEISKNVRPICLPDSNLQSSTLFQVNYESSQSDNPPERPLTKYQNKVVSNAKCNELVRQYLGTKLRKGITNELICSLQAFNASSDYSCKGESGAPLYIDHDQVRCSHIQLGIASFGVQCGMVIPEGATKVYSFSDWIESVIWAGGEDS